MYISHRQLVSNLLLDIAMLVQEANSYLGESSLSPSPVSGLGKKRPQPKLSSITFAKSSSKKKITPLIVTIQKNLKPKLRSGGLEPNKVDRITNCMRRSAEKLAKPTASVLRSRRERKARSRYQATKLVKGVPKKSLGTRLRTR